MSKDAFMLGMFSLLGVIGLLMGDAFIAGLCGFMAGHLFTDIQNEKAKP